MTTPLPKLRCLKVWAWSNCGILLGIESTKRRAIRAAEEHCGEPWGAIDGYMEVRKVTVVEGWK